MLGVRETQIRMESKIDKINSKRLTEPVNLVDVSDGQATQMVCCSSGWYVPRSQWTLENYKCGIS